MNTTTTSEHSPAVLPNDSVLPDLPANSPSKSDLGSNSPGVVPQRPPSQTDPAEGSCPTISIDPSLSPQVPAETGDASAVTSVGILGAVDTLSDSETQELKECEKVVTEGWTAFVDVGLALAQIRDKRLYRVEFESFEAYCRTKWGYGRHYVNRLVSAAQVFTYLATKSHQRRPDHETQVRPLIGLAPEQAQLAWECAVQMAGNGRVTERVVKGAIQALELRPTVTEKVSVQKPNRAAQRRIISEAFGELLMLVSQKAGHDVLMAKLEALHARVQTLVSYKANQLTRKPNTLHAGQN